MSNNQLPADVHRRIYDILLNYKHADRTQAANEIFALFQEFNIAGATAWAESIQQVIDALDQFIAFHESGLLPAKHVYEKAVAARKQWKEWKGSDKIEHNVSIGEHITYCHDCGFPIDECNCDDF